MIERRYGHGIVYLIGSICSIFWDVIVRTVQDSPHLDIFLPLLLELKWFRKRRMTIQDFYCRRQFTGIKFESFRGSLRSVLVPCVRFAIDRTLLWDGCYVRLISILRFACPFSLQTNKAGSFASNTLAFPIICQTAWHQQKSRKWSTVDSINRGKAEIRNRKYQTWLNILSRGNYQSVFCSPRYSSFPLKTSNYLFSIKLANHGANFISHNGN